MSKIAVIGAGAWGTAIAIVLGRTGAHSVTLWAFESEVCQSLASTGMNQVFLNGCKVPRSVKVTSSLQEALHGADIVTSVMPSHHCRRLFQEMSPHLRHEMLFVSATKGIENNTYMRMSEVISETVKEHCGFIPQVLALSGPSFAHEVALGHPTAITAASTDAALAKTIQREFSDAAFRIYANDDIIGVELGGAIKNVIAIAAGACDGLGLGHSSVSALITRGLAEMERLAVKCGARPGTMSGLAGLGDLVLTCTGALSRNRSVGVELGKGRKLAEIISGMHGMVAEGVLTTDATIGLAKKMHCEMPIASQVHSLLHEGKSPQDAIRELMSRPGKVE